jgi:7,8-dihydroneopterin aldolase/epimerase/oxygenase
MDRITIEELAVEAHIGVPEAERARPQKLLLTVVMECDFSKAAAGDAIDETIDYDAASQRLLAFCRGGCWKLIETLAVETAQLILQEFKPLRVSVEVKKFVIPQARFVSVRVERSR